MEEVDPYDGFERWYSAAWPRVQRMLASYCGSAPLATEVAAEAFVRAAERWPDASRRPRDPDAWVATVAFNLVKRHRQRHRREQDLPEPRPRGGVTNAHLDVDLVAAIVRLPPRMRQATVLRYVGDFTEPMVATVMGTTTGYVSSLLHRARARLAHDPSVATALEATEPGRA